MLFGYPIEAIEENWLHECLGEILQLIHTSYIEIGKSLPDWPEIVPERYRKRLKRRTGLEKRLNAYHKQIVKLTPEQQCQVLQTFKAQNEIPRLLSCQGKCESINALPTSIQEPVKDLFEFAFSLLTDLEIRDEQYKIIYDKISGQTCPFCGCEDFDAPGAVREALDHYLLKSEYPFAAANLRNLVPMGNKCNSGYKRDQDILMKDNRTRRKSFDPYNHQTVTISLNNSQPFAGTTGKTGEPLPKWEIDFSLNAEEVTTWDDVFHIRERYKRDVLDPKFQSYLKEFGSYCRAFEFVPNSTEELLDALAKYTNFQESNEFKDRAFLKAAVFRMLYVHCQKGDQRLINLIIDVVNGVNFS
jgi:hypothetical protein